MRTFSISMMFLAIVGLAAGCGDYSNPQLKEDLEFLAAIPAKETLELRVADPTARLDQVNATGYSGSSLTSRQDELVGQIARYYVDMVVGTEGINAGVLAFLQLVDWITHRIPPTMREQGRRVWGPWASDDDPGVDIRFEMRRYVNDPERTRPFSFHFQFRPEEASDNMGYDEGWVDCVSGNVDPKGFFRRGDGDMRIDLTACAGVTGSGESGYAAIDFDTAPDSENPHGKTQLTIAFRDFLSQDAIDEGEGPLTADYAFFEGSEHAGLFSFTAWADIHAGSDPQLDALETFEWRVSWGSDGCGRADARIHKGDLGAFEILATECWNPDHRRVYFSHPFPEPPEVPEEGDPADCCLPSAYE